MCLGRSIVLAMSVILVAAAIAGGPSKVSAASPLEFPWPVGHQHRVSGGSTYNCDLHKTQTASSSSSYDADYFAIDFQFGSIDGSPLDVGSVAAGTVIFRGDAYDGFGYKIVTDHGSGYTSVYAHLSSFMVNQMDQVRQGQRVGYAGATGGNYPVHLHFHMQFGLSAYKPEPISGVSAFGQYGYCTGRASSYWVSKPPLGRDATNDGCPDVFARESRSPYVLRIYPGTCAGTLTGPGTSGAGWDPSQINPIIGSTFFDDGNCAEVPAAAE